MPDQNDKVQPSEQKVEVVFIERPYTGVGVTVGTDHSTKMKRPLSAPDRAAADRKFAIDTGGALAETS